MQMRHMIWKELRERPVAMGAGLAAILLGVAAFVSIRSVAVSSELAVAKNLEALGANVLMLPADATLADYYTADLDARTLPEEHATRLVLANLEGVRHVSPRLCVTADLAGVPVRLTGILPQSEFQTKAAWGGVELFSNCHVGCKRPAAAPVSGGPESLASRRVVQELGKNEVLLGADVARQSSAKQGSRVRLLDRTFTVAAVLPPTGTVDDGRAYAHLHAVQDLAGAGPVVNAIEIMACCEDAAGKLIASLEKQFPDTRVITISQVVQTQVAVNRTMNRLSFLIFALLVAIGGASTAAAMYSNVFERRREIGTLVALGASPGFVVRLFLGKAVLLGLAGGIGGALAGTLAAVLLGPQVLGSAVEPLPSLAVMGVAAAVAVSVAASFPPAFRAAGLDPCLCFKEA
jgi:putative ABC transport system permease protein